MPSEAYMAECAESLGYADLSYHADTAGRRTLIGKRVLEGLIQELGKLGLEGEASQGKA